MTATAALLRDGDALMPSRLDLRQGVKDMIAARAAARGRFILLIGGPGCAGKSTFAIELATELKDRHGLQAAILDLDCYLIERAKRQTPAFSFGGYHPRAYRLEQASTDIRALIEGRSITVSPYDKRTSDRGPLVTVEPAPILLIEGSMALREEIQTPASAALFLDASEDVLFRNRQRREVALGLMPEQIREKFRLLCIDYDKYIAPQRRSADLVIEIDTHYAFRRLSAR